MNAVSRPLFRCPAEITRCFLYEFITFQCLFTVCVLQRWKEELKDDVKHKPVYVLHNSFKEICLFLSTWNAAVEQRGQLIHWWLECQRIYCKVLRHCNSAVNLLAWQDITVNPAISVISNMSPPSPPPPPPPILTVIFESELACSLESAAISTNLT